MNYAFCCRSCYCCCLDRSSVGLVIGHLSYLHNEFEIFMESHFVQKGCYKKHQCDIMKELTQLWAIWVCVRNNILHILRIQSWIINIIRWEYVVATFFMHPYLLFMRAYLKYSSGKVTSWSCKCSILLGLNFVEIKNSFIKMYLFFKS